MLFSILTPNRFENPCTKCGRISETWGLYPKHALKGGNFRFYFGQLRNTQCSCQQLRVKFNEHRTMLQEALLCSPLCAPNKFSVFPKDFMMIGYCKTGKLWKSMVVGARVLSRRSRTCQDRLNSHPVQATRKGFCNQLISSGNIVNWEMIRVIRDDRIGQLLIV